MLHSKQLNNGMLVEIYHSDDNIHWVSLGWHPVIRNKNKVTTPGLRLTTKQYIWIDWDNAYYPAKDGT